MALGPGAVVLDATVGLGGHAQKILEAIGPQGRLIGLDRDQESLEEARARLARFGGQVRLIHGHFGELSRLLTELPTGPLDAVLFDLGVSSRQLKTAHRGFSFTLEGPLDMRMDRCERWTAQDLINRTSLRDLTNLLRQFGQERWAGRIARAILRRRPITTTAALADLIWRAVPPGARHGRIHPATRTFQAIRIAVNRELELLPVGLLQALDQLRLGGRVAVCAYHSLEDRIVKTVLRERARAGYVRILTRKPIRPSPEEIARNPSARSACLRIAEREG